MATESNGGTGCDSTLDASCDLIRCHQMILPGVFGHLNGSRPKLLCIQQSTDLLIENLRMHNSPSFHLLLDDVRIIGWYWLIGLDHRWPG